MIRQKYKMIAICIPADEKDIELLKIRISAAVQQKERFLNEIRL